MSESRSGGEEKKEEKKPDPTLEESKTEKSTPEKPISSAEALANEEALAQAETLAKGKTPTKQDAQSGGIPELDDEDDEEEEEEFEQAQEEEQKAAPEKPSKKARVTQEEDSVEQPSTRPSKEVYLAAERKSADQIESQMVIFKDLDAAKEFASRALRDNMVPHQKFTLACGYETAYPEIQKWLKDQGEKPQVDSEGQMRVKGPLTRMLDLVAKMEDKGLVKTISHSELETKLKSSPDLSSQEVKHHDAPDQDAGSSHKPK